MMNIILSASYHPAHAPADGRRLSRLPRRLLVLAIAALAPSSVSAEVAVSAVTVSGPAVRQASAAQRADSEDVSALTAQADELAELLSTELLVEGGGRVSWSAQGDRIAYDKAGPDGIYDLYIRTLATGGERCLTCKFRDFRKAHALNPAWHPNGQSLIFQSQLHAQRLGLGADRLASPERSLWSDLWLVRVDGKDYWQLTYLSERGSAVMDPHFSHEGEVLLWSERTLSRKGRWGSWRLRTAKLTFRRGVPRLRKPKSPGTPTDKGLIISHGFTADDRGFLISAQFDQSLDSRALDIYRLSEDPELERLTRSRGGWHEYARLSPRGDLVAFTSDAEFPRGEQPIRTELWLMKLDGSDKRRLTRFNDEGGFSSCYVGDFEWSPRGDRIIAQLLCGDGERKEALYQLRLSEALARPTRSP